MNIDSILVIGSTGMLGRAVSKYFRRKKISVTSLSRPQFDIISDPIEKLNRYIENVDTVINCAGIIKPLINKTTIENVLQVNSIFPQNLSKILNKKNIQCFHIATDCVFSGNKGNYTEEDIYDADDIYGMTKSAGDSTECMTLRTSIIGEEKGKALSLLEWARSHKNKSVNGYINHFWNGVTTVYLAEIIETIMNNDLYKKGIYHIFSKETVTKYELLRIISQVYRLNLNVNKHKAEIPVNRSLSSKHKLAHSVVRKSLSRQIVEMKRFFIID